MFVFVLFVLFCLSMQKHRDITLSRLGSFKTKTHLRGLLYKQTADVVLHKWAAPDRVSFKQATCSTNEYIECNIGG